MKKRILSAIAAATVLVSSTSGIYAADTAELSPRASVVIDDAGYINGIVGTATAEYVASQFTGDVTLTTPKGENISGETLVTSDTEVKSGDTVLAKVLISGDADCNGNITIGDVTTILKHIAKWDNNPICIAAADVDGAAGISISDATYILKNIAKWDGYTLGEEVPLTVFEDGVTEYKLLANSAETDTVIAEAIKELTGNDIEIVNEVEDGEKFITVGINLNEKYDFIDGDAVAALSDTEAYIDTYGENIYLTANSDNGILGCVNYITAQAFTPELDMEITKGKVGTLGDLETLVTPLFNTLEIEGLENEYRFLHVTDSHLTTIYEDEENSDRYNDVVNNRVNTFKNQYRQESRLFFNEFFNYAENINADAMLLTGDITDSPSLSNIDIVKNAISNCSVPSFYIYGNHDWTWNDNYQNANYRYQYESRFKDAVSVYDEDWDDMYNCIEYSDLMIVSLDNSGYEFKQQAYNGLKNSLDKAKAENKPVIIMLHIPIHTEEMHAYIDANWPDGGALCIGEGGSCNSTDNPNSVSSRVCNLITAEDSPVVAIFSGHVHFNYEVMIDGRIPQYVTGAAYQGYCRVVDLVPAAE